MGVVCRLAQRLTERSFVKQAWFKPGRFWWWCHVRQCQQCRSHYDNVMNMDRWLASGSQTRHLPSDLELETFLPVVLDQVAPSTIPAKIFGAVSWLFQPFQKWTLAGASVGVVLVVASIVVTQRQEPEWRMRGSEASGLSIRMFCEEKDPLGHALIRSISDTPGPSETASCPQDGILRFAYVSPTPGYLWILVTQEDGSWHGVLPWSGEAPPVHVDRATQLKSLPLRIGPKILAGRDHVVLVYVLSPEPMELADAVSCADQVLADNPCGPDKGIQAEARRINLDAATNRGKPR